MADMANGARTYVAIQRNNFQGNGNCDDTREANRRANRVTGMESEIAPYYGPTGPTGTAGMANTTSTTSTTSTTNGTSTGGTTSTVTSVTTSAPAESGAVGSSVAERQMAAMNAAESRAASAGTTGGTESDMIDDGYGIEYVRTEQEEEGMSSFPQDSFMEPLTASEAARNSWRALLARNVGRNVLVRFLVGTQNITTVEGELYEVGTDYIVIYQPLWDSHITADLYMVKFVEFREPTGMIALN